MTDEELRFRQQAFSDGLSRVIDQQVDEWATALCCSRFDNGITKLTGGHFRRDVVNAHHGLQEQEGHPEALPRRLVVLEIADV